MMRLLLVAVALALLGCALLSGAADRVTPRPAATAPPPPTPPVTAQAATAGTTATRPAVPPDTGWQALRPGLERRVVNLRTPEGLALESLYLLRLEAERFEFGVAYRPGQPQSLDAWLAETGALLVVNGGYFTEAGLATGLIVAEGQVSGASYGEFAGMLAVTEAGPELRWLRERPYDPAERLLAAVQSFPLLVKPGGEVGYPEEDGAVSRRTVVGQDRQGRIVFLVAPRGGLTLHRLSVYLAGSDLELELALNLDGGTSSGALLREPAEGITAYALLPAVITVQELNR